MFYCVSLYNTEVYALKTVLSCQAHIIWKFKNNKIKILKGNGNIF